jgi:hypothetical protein
MLTLPSGLSLTPSPPSSPKFARPCLPHGQLLPGTPFPLRGGQDQAGEFGPRSGHWVVGPLTASMGLMVETPHKVRPYPTAPDPLVDVF